MDVGCRSGSRFAGEWKASEPGLTPAVDAATTTEGAMPDKKEEAQPKADEKPHKVNEKAQEDAAQERSENEGYD